MVEGCDSRTLDSGGNSLLVLTSHAYFSLDEAYEDLCLHTGTPWAVFPSPRGLPADCLGMYIYIPHLEKELLFL